MVPPGESAAGTGVTVMTPTDANAGRPTPGRTLSVIQLRPIDGGVGLAATADLVFLDAEKEDYLRMLELAIEALRPGGLLIADNLASHEADLADFRETALADPRLAGLVVPIGRGELVAVRL